MHLTTIPVTLAVLAGVVGVHAAAADPPVKYARLCAQGARELAAARTRLGQLDHSITTAAADAPAAPLLKELEALLDTPCFQVARAAADGAIDKVTTVALKAWWRDGGKEWLGVQLAGSQNVVFPPTMRKTLTLDSAPKHPLARLLCRATDATCGSETAGWQARAERAFRDGANHDARWHGNGYSSGLYDQTVAPAPADDGRNETLDLPLWQCAHPAGKRDAKLDYPTWQACVQKLRVAVASFPVGRLRAPTTGWLVVRGRRGHYQFCDELTAYDLATGAYYASKSCSGLALAHDGSVDGTRTDAARVPKLETGRLPLDNLREAAWMILFAGEIESSGFPDADYFPLPPGVEPKVEIGEGGSFGSGSYWGSSAQTSLAWAWIDGGKLVVEGALTWPNSARRGQDHADELLRIAEAGLVPGCPPAPLPDPILAGCGKGGVSSLDGKPAKLCEVQADLSARLAGFKCTAH
jgi:hypothetical protein